MRLITCTVLLLGTQALAQSSLQSSRPVELPANTILVRPSPSAPLSDWVDAPGRTTVVIEDGGSHLRGWRYESPHRHAPTLLFFNGNGMTIDRSDSLYREIADAGANVTVYDYRGIGFSNGLPDVMQLRTDALSLYDHLAAQGPVIVYGFSLGTAMATYVASQRPVAGLILAGTIGTAQEELPVYLAAQGVHANVIAAPDAIEAFNEAGMITHSTAPLLMIHGEADRLVPIEQGREVFAASPSVQKRFVALPGVSHNGTAGAAASLDAVRQFLGQLSTKP